MSVVFLTDTLVFLFFVFVISWRPLPVVAGWRGTVPTVLSSVPPLPGKAVHVRT